MQYLTYYHTKHVVLWYIPSYQMPHVQEQILLVLVWLNFHTSKWGVCLKVHPSLLRQVGWQAGGYLQHQIEGGEEVGSHSCMPGSGLHESEFSVHVQTRRTVIVQWYTNIYHLCSPHLQLDQQMYCQVEKARPFCTPADYQYIIMMFVYLQYSAALSLKFSVLR